MEISFKTKIQEDTKSALKVKDELRLLVLRMLSAALHNKEIEKRTKSGETELSEEEALAVLRTEVKKRRDAIEGFTQGGRRDLVEKETKELAILEIYLPAEISEQEIKKTVQAVLNDLGQVTEKDLGRVMGEAMKRLKGQASGDRVRKVAAEELKYVQ